MATSSLSYPPQEFNFKEVQLVVRETPSIPADVKPFVGVSFSSSAQVFKVLSDLKSMDVETFLCLHLDCKNTIKALQVVSIGSLGSSSASTRGFPLSYPQRCRWGHLCSQPPKRRSCAEQRRH